MTTPDRAAAATRSSWHILPPPHARAPLVFSYAYSQAEFERLQRRLVPFVMEDKWFVYFEEPWLYFYRSWSGACIFAVRLIARWSMSRRGLGVSQASEYTGTDAGYDAELLRFLVDALLLGRRCVLPCLRRRHVRPRALFRPSEPGLIALAA